ncbi:hypothetical protein ACFQYP_13050 [Nonomuraea antimicrobica]
MTRTPSGHVAVRWDGNAVRQEPYRLPRPLRRRARMGRIKGQLRPHDGSSRIMLAGLAGLLAVLFADWAWSVAVHRRAPIEALFDAVRTVSTVGPASAHGSDGYLLFASVAMITTMVFTAGMVDRLSCTGHGSSRSSPATSAGVAARSASRWSAVRTCHPAAPAPAPTKAPSPVRRLGAL